MDFWDHEAKQSPTQVALRDWAVSHKPNAFVTLTFRQTPYSDEKIILNSGVSYMAAARIFGSFAHALKSHYFGSKSKKRMFLLPVVEGSGVEHGGSPYTRQDSTHVHLIARLPQHPADAQELIRSCWISASGLCGDPKTHCEDSDAWCQVLPSPEAQIAATQYAIKSCALNTDTVLANFLTDFRT